MSSTSSFCHHVNLLKEDLNVRASSLGGVVGRKNYPQSAPPSRELAPRQGTQLRREFHPLGGQNEKINFEEY